MQTGDKETSSGDDEERSAASSEERRPHQQPADQQTSSSSSGLDLGPIAMSFGGSTTDTQGKRLLTFFQLITPRKPRLSGPGCMLWRSSISDPLNLAGEEAVYISGMQSIHSMRTEDWQEQYEADGYVDLWVEEEFNAGSRLVVRIPCAVLP